MSTHSTTKWKTICCWVGALLPLGFAIIAHQIGPRAHAAPEKRDVPSLAFSQYLVDDGKPVVRPIYRAQFYFQNTSQKTVTIKELRPSCGCLNPKLEKREYAPGEEGHFQIRVDPTKEKSGAREYFVDVVYEDPDPHEIRVTYKIVLPERSVEITPRALVFYHLPGNTAETEQDVKISDYRSEHFKILSMESTSPLVRAMLIKEDDDDAGNRHHELKVIVQGDIPTGTSRAIINIHTDDPEFRLLQLPILISGPQSSVSKEDLPLKVDPPSLYLKADAQGEVKTSLTFYDFQARPAKLRSVTLNSIEGKIETGDQKSSQLGPLVRERDLALSLKIPNASQEHKGLLVIETDSELQPRLEVPIVIEAAD